MKKKAFGGGAAFALFLAIAWTSVLAIPDCGFAGTVTVHGAAVPGDQVAAYLSDNLSQQVGLGAGSLVGYGIGIAGASGNNVTFMVGGLFADQPDQLCTDPTQIKTLNLTVTDGDRDGYNYTEDCNDSNPSIHPGATDTCGNGIDEDCSGSDLACPSGSSGGSSEEGGSGGGGGGGYSCTPNWTCVEWSSCSGSAQSRTCTDSNSCGTTTGKPAETQNCTYSSAGACTEGMRVCAGSDLMECLEGQWIKIEDCDYGCSDSACLENPEEEGAVKLNEAGLLGGVTGLFLLEPSAWPFWILIAFLAILVVWLVLRRGGKKKKAQAGGWTGYKPKAGRRRSV